MTTPESQMFQILRHWTPERNLLKPSQLLNKSDKNYLLFERCYNLVKEQCKKSPRRKNGEPSFIHPLNVVVNLKRSGIHDGLTKTIGLLHDLVEDHVDSYCESKIFGEKCPSFLQHQELLIYTHLENEIKKYCTSEEIALIKSSLQLLTRKKQESYYQSIAKIFHCKDTKVKETAICVKLADRTHNILCIETFSEKRRIHECFKTLFILNNIKKYLQKKIGKKNISTIPSVSPLSNLFKMCCKATYDAFLRICELSNNKGLSEIRSLLQLSFRKYAHEQGGLWEVTKINTQEVHPVRLFQGVIRKYDHMLMHNFEQFETIEENEKDYCTKFFSTLNLSKQQIQAIIDYKDCYALKEVVAKLLYDQEYVLPGFLTTSLSSSGRIC